jgi:hypothetical protein
VLSGRPLALFLLGWSLAKALARRALHNRSGLIAFENNYGSEGLGTINPHERQELSGFSKCIACGRCDFGEGQRIVEAAGAYPGLMQLVRASSRSMPDFDAAAAGFSHLEDAELADKTARCPVGMPFSELAEFVRNHAERPEAPEQLSDRSERLLESA